jgi:hypothetical protein
VAAPDTVARLIGVASTLMASKPLFISHAAGDTPVADALADLLHQLKLNEDDIFCASLEGMGIPAGKNFADFIRDQIQSPKLVVLLLSPNYFESTFCVAELGACWAISHNIFPLLLAPDEYDGTDATLLGIQTGKIDSKKDLNDLRDVISKVFGVSVSSARWETKRDAFLAKLPQLRVECATPERAPLAEFKRLKSDYEEAKGELDRAERIIDRLKKAKDKEEVEEIEAEETDVWDQLEQLCDKAKEGLRPLPSIVEDLLMQ